MLGGAKVLFAIVGGFVGISGASSLSSLEWDPPNVWRVNAKEKFYLSNCFNNPHDKHRGQWTNSNLWIYLTVVKDSGSYVVGENTKLELRAEGWSEKWESEKISVSRKHDDISLQSIAGGASSEGNYKLTKEYSVRLGEVGSGESSQVFGDSIDCSNKIFDLTGSKEYGVISLGLNKVTFQLERDSSPNKYRGREVYSIKIISSDGDKQLKWANNFKPIVTN